MALHAQAKPPLPQHAAIRTLQLDVSGRASLDGTWMFYPGDHDPRDLDQLTPVPISVPGLWETRGHLDLDGYAWYRLPFAVPDPTGYWTLRFAAVMDFADVYLNGAAIGRHEQPFTPFELNVTGVLREGDNVLDVRVFDPPVDHSEHIRSAHGKQGWANHVFPSPPSLYMTFGGIWQSVTLRRHGAVRAADVFVNSSSEDLTVTVALANVSDQPAVADVGVHAVGLVSEMRVELAAGEVRSVTAALGRTSADRWSPESPVLHSLMVDIAVDGTLNDRRELRFGLRDVSIEGTRLCINGEPYRMKSVLVQGFRADTLYAEGSREQIEAEVLAAKAMGFTMLRLHIKAFAPEYLDVCDELGMLVECDLPIAEPIAHDELGDGTLVSRRCVEAVTEQVRRDRNHPSIVLWSAMNELGLDREGARATDAYEQFARRLYAAVREADPTRPVIENEWVEPDPDRVFCSPILTAHWYGRLHAAYLDKLERESLRWRDTGRPLFVSEFGDWGLPDMPPAEDPPFWDTREVYAAGIAGSPWPATVARFLRETQRYQGLSDRLQIEVFRRHDHIGGYCLTELTDVPAEYNGLLDLHRNPKPVAVAEVTRANQTVLPMLHLPSLVAAPGEVLRAPAHIANDGPGLSDVTIDANVGDAVASRDSVGGLRVGNVAGYAARYVGDVAVAAPEIPGAYDLLVTLRSAGEVVAENRYPISVVPPLGPGVAVRVLDTPTDGRTRAALGAIGTAVGASGPLVVAEEGLDAGTSAQATAALAAGETVVVLAQPPDAAMHYPVPVEIFALETAWGSSTFQFTTDSGALPSLPRRTLLVGEETTVQAASVLVRVDGAVFPDEPVVIAFKPVPDSITGTVVGGHAVGNGRLLLCQYRLVDRVLEQDSAARALLSDVMRWAAVP